MATLRQVFHDIAESIRSKGVSGEFKPVDMASKIGQIKNVGYLTFTAEEDTTLTLVQNGNITPHKLLKSTDGVNWTKWENPATNGIVLKTGESVYLKDDEDALNRTATGDNDFNSYSSTGRIKCNGALMPEISLKPVSNDYSYFVSKLFRDCSTLTKSPEFPAKTLAPKCYFGTLVNCSSLTSAPELPATTLADQCYYNMFYKCTSLTTAPELPATTLAPLCYLQMFKDCTSLTQAPDLPATTLAEMCYSYMFNGCTSLVKAPTVLPATTLANNCYDGMFSRCTSLTNAPELPAMTLANNCYSNMFKDCTSLTTAPELPATTLNGNCYEYMFVNCKSLTTAPELPATTLADYCYQGMFGNCTSLTTAPELPATTLTEGCYQFMFFGCTSLEIGPELTETNTVGNLFYCYSNMFQNCTSLKRIKINLSDGWLCPQMFDGCTSLELVDMTGSTSIQPPDQEAFANTNDTFKVVVPDEQYNYLTSTPGWMEISDHIMKKSDWNTAHPDDQL